MINEGYQETFDKVKQGMLGNVSKLIKKYKNPDAIIYGKARKEAKKVQDMKNTNKLKEAVKAALMDEKANFSKKYDNNPALKGGQKKLHDKLQKAIIGSKKNIEEDLDLGHEDNEPHMIKADLYKIGKYAMELYQMVDQFEGQGEVDFPAWWQSKITNACNMISSAKHYLEFELKEPEIDAMVGVASNEKILDDVEEGIHHKDILFAPHTNIKTPSQGKGNYDPKQRAALKQILQEEKSKRDRCLRIADRKFDKPSAYKSGAVVKCRQGKIWKDLKETATSKEIKDFFIDFGMLISFNFSQITKMGKDESATKELSLMMQQLRKPIINGKNYFEFINNIDINTIPNNPKLVSILLGIVKNFLIYIEPRVQQFVKDGPASNGLNYKEGWLKRINDIKDKYKKII